MDNTGYRTGFVNWLALLIAAVASYLVASSANSATGLVSVIFLGVGFLIAFVSYFQMRLGQREQLEKMEYDELVKAKGGSTLFAEPSSEAFPAQRSREQFERFFVPGFTVLILILQGTAAYQLWVYFKDAPAPVAGKETLVMAMYALVALVLFLLGKYSARLSRSESLRLLRPGAGYLMLGSILCFVTAVVEAASKFEFKRADLYTAKTLTIILMIVTIETLINLVLEIYRPRVKGQAARMLYESRLIGLLGQPGGIITTAAQALDYQFGFKVSETWFYRFLERAFAWLLLLQLAALFASTCFVVIEPYEQGLLERFGKPVEGRSLLEPGLHVKWFWPIDKVYRHRTRAVQTFIVGPSEDEDHDKEKIVLWTRAHFKDEFSLLVASRDNSVAAPQAGAAPGDQAVPVNLLSASIPVQYRITDIRAWAYGHANASNMIENVASREVIRYLINVDIDELLTTGRSAASEALRTRIQAGADKAKLGVEIMLVGLEDIHPPVKVAEAYEQVIGAFQEAQTNILAAQAYRAERIPAAQMEATNIINQALADKINKVASAAGDASLYQNQLIAYAAAPLVYLRHAYFDTLVRALIPTRKVVLGITNTHDIFQINLEDKISTDMLDVSPMPVAPKK